MAIELSTNLAPKNEEGFFLAEGKHLKDVIILVADNTARDALPTPVKVEGVIVFSVASDAFYQYLSNVWVLKPLGAGGSVTASNGLTKTASDIKLGGPLTEPTTISGSGGLNVLTIDMATGDLSLKGTNIILTNFGSFGVRYDSGFIPLTASLVNGSIPSWSNVTEAIANNVLTFDNGLNYGGVGSPVKLGGALIEDTNLLGDDLHSMSIGTAASKLVDFIVYSGDCLFSMVGDAIALNNTNITGSITVNSPTILLDALSVELRGSATANPSRLFIEQASTELSSSSTNGLELSKITQTPGVTIIETRDDNVGVENNGRIVTSTNSVELSTQNASLESNVFTLSDSIIKLTDEINQKGMEYSADYSANYTDRSLVDKAYVNRVVTYDLDFKASKNAPLSLTLAIYGDATIVGTENKAGQVTGVTYYGSTDGGETFDLIGNHLLLIAWVGSHSGAVIYLKASMITTSTQEQVVNVTYIKS